jgi:hypothetical protein
MEWILHLRFHLLSLPKVKEARAETKAVEVPSLSSGEHFLRKIFEIILVGADPGGVSTHLFDEMLLRDDDFLCRVASLAQ